MKSFPTLAAIMVAIVMQAANACDTFVVMPDASATKTTLLGKNSDRPAFDSQALMFVQHSTWPRDATIKLAYREIPQIQETYQHIGSSPYWCWGYEEGINEHGVAIGNEAIFTKNFKRLVALEERGDAPAEGLLGMELLRLALERGKTAREALDVITSLVEQYGQWGSGVPCAGHAAGGYDNSYIIADHREACILETVGNMWIARRVTRGVAWISNQPSIRTKWDRIHPKLIDHAIDNGWWPEAARESFDFALAYIDFETPMHLSMPRYARGMELLTAKEGKIDLRYSMRTLRDHYETTFLGGPFFNAALPDFLTICMHSSPAGFTWGNTASSMIAVIPPPGSPDGIPVMWWLPVTPCTGAYMPFYPHGSSLPAILSAAGKAGKTVTPPPDAIEDSFAPDSYWWLFRQNVDRVKGCEHGSQFNRRQPMIRAHFDARERDVAARAWKVEEEAAQLLAGGKRTEAAKLLDEFVAGNVASVLEELRVLGGKMGSPDAGR